MMFLIATHFLLDEYLEQRHDPLRGVPVEGLVQFMLELIPDRLRLWLHRHHIADAAVARAAHANGASRPVTHRGSGNRGGGHIGTRGIDGMRRFWLRLFAWLVIEASQICAPRFAA